MKTTRIRAPRKVKYLIIASEEGKIYGSFFPEQEANAKKYLAEVQAKEKDSVVNMYSVSNLNQFLAKLRYGTRVKRKTN